MVALALFALIPLICSHDLKLSTSTKDIVGQCMAPNLCEDTTYMWHKRINITSKQLFGTNGAFH